MERFWNKVNKTEGCWNWLASKDDGGYGIFHLNGGMRKSHRVAYEFEVGIIPEGMVLDHLCNNKACVNPSHLEVVTQKVNVHRHFGVINRTHCKKGHAWVTDNIYMVKGEYPQCRVCKKEAVAKHYQTKGRKPHANHC